MKILALLLFLITCLSSHAQSSTDIKAKIRKANDKKKADLYLDLGLQIYTETGELDSLLKYSLKSLELAKKTKDVRTQINAYKYSSTAYAYKYDFEKSNEQLKKGLVLSKKINHKMNIADIYNKFGYNYQVNNESKKGLQYYIKAAKIFEEIKNYDQLIISYQNISGVFSFLEQPKQVEFYTLKMIETLPKLKDNFSVSSTYSAISDRYSYIYETTGRCKKEYYKYLMIGLDFSKKYEFYNEWAELNNNLAVYYYLNKNYKQSNETYISTLKLKQFIREPNVGEAYFGLFSYNYKIKKDLKTAALYIDSLEKLSIYQISDLYKVQVLPAKYEYAKQSKNTELALETLELLKKIQDSAQNVEKISAVSELEEKYNRVKNESTIKELNRTKKIDEQKASIQSLKINQLIIGVLLLIVILGIIVYFYYQNNQKRKRKISEVEQRLNRARMDPHFVFNVLGAVQALHLNPERKDEAPLFISKISKVMRLTLESTYTELTSLEDEIDFLTEYIELQRLLKNNAFNYSITVSDKLDPFEVQIPGMILQPFIENAIEHGLAGANNDGLVTMIIEPKNNELHITITDNGKGKVNESKQRIYPSRATSIINDRLSLLKDTYKKNARFETAIKENSGYEVHIVLPLL